MHFPWACLVPGVHYAILQQVWNCSRLGGVWVAPSIVFFAAVPLCVRTFQHHRERRHVQPFSTLLTAAFQGMCEVWSRSSCIADIVAPPRVLRMAAQTCIWDQFDKRATVGGKSCIFWEMVDPYLALGVPWVTWSLLRMVWVGVCVRVGNGVAP